MIVPEHEPGIPGADSYRWVILAAATITQAGTAFVFLGVGALAGFIQEDFALTGLQTGLLVTAVGAAPLAMLIPAGRLLDRGLERRVITGGALLLATGAALAGLSESYLPVLGFLFVGGAGYSASQPGGSKVVAGWFPAGQRGLAMGIRQTALPLGGAVAASTLPVVAVRSGWGPALVVGAIVAAAGGLCFGAAYRPLPSSARDEPIGLRAELQGLLGMPGVRLAMLAGLGMVAAQFILISYLMLYLRDVHSIPLSQGAPLLFATQAAGVAGRISLASWSDRLGNRLTPVGIGAGMTALALWAFAGAPPGSSTFSLIVLSVIVGFFAFGWYGPWVVFVAETAPGRAVGTTLALAMTANQLAIVAAPPMFGFLYDLTGSYGAPLLATGALLALLAVRIWWSGSRHQETTSNS